MIFFAIFSLLCIVTVVLFILGLNHLYRLRNIAHEAWANVLVSLKRRHDVVPQLVSATATMQTFETSVQTAIAAGRSGNVTETAAAEQALQKNLLAVVEAYPDMAADANFRDLMHALRNIEDDIQSNRLLYNRSVAQYRRACQIFPLNVVAYTLQTPPPEFFDLAPVDTSAK